MELERLVEIINTEFSEPFLPKDFVRARMKDNGSVEVFIGPRDVNIGKDGSVMGAGTALRCWDIKRSG